MTQKINTLSNIRLVSFIPSNNLLNPFSVKEREKYLIESRISLFLVKESDQSAPRQIFFLTRSEKYFIATLLHKYFQLSQLTI